MPSTTGQQASSQLEATSTVEQATGVGSSEMSGTELDFDTVPVSVLALSVPTEMHNNNGDIALSDLSNMLVSSTDNHMVKRHQHSNPQALAMPSLSKAG